MKYHLIIRKKKNIDVHSKEKKEKPGIIQYFERIDEIKERYASFTDKISKESSNFSKQKFDFTYSFDHGVGEKKIKNDKNKEKSIQRSNTITNYKEFSEIVNRNDTTLKEKLEADMDNNPSTIDFPEIKDSKKNGYVSRTFNIRRKKKEKRIEDDGNIIEKKEEKVIKIPKEKRKEKKERIKEEIKEEKKEKDMEI